MHYCYLQLVGDYYKSQDAVLGHDQRVEFLSDCICLDVPASGVTTEDQSWKIRPLSHPEVHLSRLVCIISSLYSCVEDSAMILC